MCQAGGQINASRGFAYATFLIRDCQNFHALLSSTMLSNITKCRCASKPATRKGNMAFGFTASAASSSVGTKPFMANHSPSFAIKCRVKSINSAISEKALEIT
jgi:hypothetical protein